MSYLVLARKYRPQSFDDLVGQDHVARTLANAIASGRVAHAFLFTGVRGVGKTTSARLLAKCLNCVGADGQSKVSTSKPCQVCGPCKEITGGSDIDVQEIDGASYNGVDEVRRLQEGIAFRPARDRYKIYIVDEVHMLSNAAWNAFLKTLEEPPPHVKFIFATTEVHKVPVTILSRCQRYDFKLISTQRIAGRLKEVVGTESIAAEDSAIAVLAREAAGSMRDAMSLLDQVIAFSGTKLTGDDVARVLGVADRAILHELATALVSGDGAACLRVVHRLAEQGFDIAHVTKDVLRHLRNLVVAKVCGEGAGELMDLADEESRDVMELAARADADDLTRLYQGFSRGYDEIVRSGQPRTALEMTLVRLARRPALLPLDELLVRLGELEKRVATNAPPPNAPRGGGSGSGGAGGRGAYAAAASGSAPQAMFAAPSSASSSSERTHGSLALSSPSLALASPAEAARAPELAPVPPLQMAVARAPEPITPPAARAPAKLEAIVAPPDVALAHDGAWRDILARVRLVRAPLASVLEHAIPLEMTQERVLLGFEPKSAFLAEQAKDPEALEILTREVRAHFGVPTEVALDLSAQRTPGVKTVAAVETERRQAATVMARAAVTAHPLVQEAIRVFGAEVREIKLPPERD